MHDSISLFCPKDKQHYDLEKGFYSCPHQTAGEEHFLEKEIDFSQDKQKLIKFLQEENAENPFYRYRHFLGGYQLFGSDAEYKKYLDEINNNLKTFDTPFLITPFIHEQKLSRELQNQIFVKNETTNVSGSHKARHLMGTLLYTEALRRQKGQAEKPKLAIYSCGNAALGAAHVAKAAGYQLTTFVPETVNQQIAKKLEDLNAIVHKVGRDESSIGSGDPTYNLFYEYVTTKGYIPFSCSGNDNWSNIEGGETLGLEIVTQAKEQGLEFDAILLQVGGGALARAVMKAFEELHSVGYIFKLPRFFVVQTKGAFPLVRAYFILLNKLSKILNKPLGISYERTSPEGSVAELYDFVRSFNNKKIVDEIKEKFDSEEVQETLKYSLYHRAKFMWAWDGNIPESIAEGILDDTTYDWYKIIENLLRTGGIPVIASEEELKKAHEKVKQTTFILPSHTGTSGLAGIYSLQQNGWLQKDQKIGVIVTGIER